MLRFRFRLLTSYGSGSRTVINFGCGSAKVGNKSTVPVPLRQEVVVPKNCRNQGFSYFFVFRLKEPDPYLEPNHVSGSWRPKLTDLHKNVKFNKIHTEEGHRRSLPEEEDETVELDQHAHQGEPAQHHQDSTKKCTTTCKQGKLFLTRANFFSRQERFDGK